jgi:hypothetical protein
MDLELGPAGAVGRHECDYQVEPRASRFSMSLRGQVQGGHRLHSRPGRIMCYGVRPRALARQRSDVAESALVS